jgi:hypothetical protein
MEISEIYKPPAYGATADVEDWLVHNVILTIRQKNHDRSPTARQHIVLKNASLPRNEFVPFGTPVRIHNSLCSSKSKREVCATISFICQGGSQQLIRRTREIVFYGGRRLVVEEDQTICVPPDSVSLGIAIYGCLTCQPEAVKGRED